MAGIVQVYVCTEKDMRQQVGTTVHFYFLDHDKVVF